jgi:hypothetical protein
MKAISSIVAAISVAMLATNSWGSSNLNLSKSNVNRFSQGVLATSSVNFNGIGTVYTTPADGDFILTQFCADPSARGGIRLTVANFGTIAQTVDGVPCHTFAPGVSIPQSSALICSITPSANARGTYFCTISGMQTPESAATPTATPTPMPPL